MNGDPSPRAPAACDQELAALRDLLDHGPVLYFCWKPEPPAWPVTFASANVEALLGYSAASFVSGAVTWAAIALPEDMERAEDDAIARLASRDPGWCQDYRVRTRTGDVRWLRDWVQASYDDQGRPLRLQSLVLDLTEAKAAEHSLAASERRYRLIVETAQEGIWIIDAESRTTFANTRMADLLGYTVDEMRGRSLFDFTDREGRQLAERNVQRRREGIGEQHEFRFIHRSGRPVWTLIETNPLRDEQGRYAGALAMVMDITARRLAEEERRNLQAGLLRLQKAESLGLMAGGIAHDFNNILTAITGNLDLARGQLTETHPAAACLRAAQQASDRAAELCRHMLTYSGGGHLDTARHDLTDLLRAWQPALARELPAAQRLELALPERPLPVEVDPAQVRQALLHVLRNAVEAAGQDPGVITLAAQLRPCTADDLQTPWMPDQRPAGDYVEVSVTDQGGGMSTDTLQRIFDPFFSTKFTGRGLGLPATLGIVRMHHGVVKVESRLGEGTTFRLLLPLARGPAQPARATRSDAPAQRRTILVADDEPAIRSLCTQMLEHYGFSVLVAADGTEAVEVFQREGDAVHCLLLDVTMPRMGGAEALQAIRRLSPHVPAIITSGYSEQDVAARFAHTPFDTFLQKPFNSHALRQAVQQALGRIATV